LADLFGGEYIDGKVKADWVTNDITAQHGQILQLGHNFYWNEHIYESETYYSIVNGKIIDQKRVDYLERDSTLLFPGLRFLQLYLRDIILQSIITEERDKLVDNKIYTFFIAFDQSRAISRIDLIGQDLRNAHEEIIIASVRKSLSELPILMNVNHENYNPPSFRISMSGYCWKFHNDIEHRCCLW